MGFRGGFLKNSHKIIWLDIVSEYNYWTQDIVFERYSLNVKCLSL